MLRSESRFYRPWTLIVSDEPSNHICRTFPLYMPGDLHSPMWLQFIAANCTHLHPSFFSRLARYDTVNQLTLERCSLRNARELGRIIDALKNLEYIYIVDITFASVQIRPLSSSAKHNARLHTVKLYEVDMQNMDTLASVLGTYTTICSLTLKGIRFESPTPFTRFVGMFAELEDLILDSTLPWKTVGPSDFGDAMAETSLGLRQVVLGDFSQSDFWEVHEWFRLSRRATSAPLIESRVIKHEVLLLDPLLSKVVRIFKPPSEDLPVRTYKVSLEQRVK